ncbi:hypothetical protein F4804DRAFT_65095 [Jackrogersella minutella]|nr:hypothetical protein F4804DRAFT_65095 [Jackrogersella minutella]
MCHENIYTYVYPDGQESEKVKYDLCADSRHNKPCKLTKTFQHPTEFVRTGQLSTPAISYGQFPPTPPLSSHSASDSEHSSKERSGVYINGEKVVDLNRRSSRRDRGERTVYVESPALSRTPPRRYSVSRNASSSPRDEARESRRHENSADSRDRSNSSHSRSHSRPIVEVKVVNEQRHDSTHRRHGSSKSSSQDDDNDSERRRRRRDSHVRFDDEDKKKDEERRKQIQSEIERQNDLIASRSAVPQVASAQPNARYRRGSVVVDRNDTALVQAMDQLTLDRKREKRAAERFEREEEAQKQRLRDRLAPKPQTTISRSHTHGHGRARHNSLYDDSSYY